ncbi:CPBP family intramembrane glutamic endopeptidase [Nocardioides sp.]|uniref:CPBP family intramembrane glutamic endopeptidase n=1 Tax=Nocardioides sp. TaxID=35761 RepID=UPI002C2D9BFF|nr:CPBP family intramembrane glutamic endopeptidase [Nocardioides sp.]HSX67005.1 CPBP family intramembrane glutamic endopeptidase [Nocardioides sp.]
MATTSLGYHQLQRSGPRGWWRQVLGILLVVVGMFVLSGVFGIAAYAIEALLAGGLDAASDPFDDPGPVLMGGILLGLAAAIPLVLLASWALHGVLPGFVVSIAGRIRWRYLVGCLGLSVIALMATLVVGALLPSGTREQLSATTTFTLDARMVALLLTVGLLTPLQAAGEEFVFRGYLTQAFGALFPTAVAVLLPALLFALAHGSQSAPIFVDRLAFGVIAGLLVVLTGGLEAGIAMHVVNNWLAFGVAILTGGLGEALQPTGGTWWSLPGTLTQSLVYLALAVWLARRQGLASRVPA